MAFSHLFNRLRNRGTLDKHGPGGETVLTAAIKMGDLKSATQFIELGASVDRANAAGEYPIFLTLAQEDRDFFRLLIEEEANIGLRQHGKTLVEAAREAGREDVAKIVSGIVGQLEQYLLTTGLGGSGVIYPPSRALLFKKDK